MKEFSGLNDKGEYIEVWGTYINKEEYEKFTHSKIVDGNHVAQFEIKVDKDESFFKNLIRRMKK
jgi:hypothetical protein